MPFAQCLLPQAIDRPLTYAVPEALAGRVGPGVRVQVPLRGKEAVALVLGLTATAPEGLAIRELTKVLDAEPFYDAAMLKFLAWVGDYYLAPAGLVLRAAWPQGTRTVRKREPRAAAVEPAGAAAGGREAPRRLNPAQQAALDRIGGAMAARRYEPFLLHGVTGSGKTEVYLHAAGAALDAGRSALVLVPEITLAHQVVAWFRARFGDRVTVLHSRLTGAERMRALEACRRGPRIVVGARSAVFAPLAAPGLIVVDEEHEAAYKQEETAPFYHARDCALMRGKFESCPVVLGSATPALETAAQARRGTLPLLAMPGRIDATPLPRMEVVSMRFEGASRAIGSPLAAALRETVARGDQALLFLNRRGFAPVLLCTGCGKACRCTTCSTTMVFHPRETALKCHWCGARVPVPRRCPDCGAEALRALGLGTQRVEQEAADLLPGARLVRMDQDTTRSRTAHGELLDRFADGDVLIGTQMVAKGLDFPRLALVGVIMADEALALPDFRAAERTFQILTQVAGRAGRRSVQGRVIIQTHAPTHPVILAAAAHDYWKAFDAEVAVRKLLGYPPYGRLVRFRLTGRRREEVVAAARRLAATLGTILPPKTVVLGPAPAHPAMVANTHRWHLVLKGPSGAALRVAARRGLDALARGVDPHRVRVTADPDPVNVMS